jgi:hypothetical protein
MSSRSNDDNDDSLALDTLALDLTEFPDLISEPLQSLQSLQPVLNIEVPIFKVYDLIGENTVSTVTVFYGRSLNKPEEELEEMVFNDSGNSLITNIFSKKELDALKSLVPRPSVKFINASLRMDDSIERIKLKIMTAMGNQFSTEEMYLFCCSEETHNPSSLYLQLSQSDSFRFNQTHLSQFLTNLHDYVPPADFTAVSTDYTINDIMKLQLQGNSFVTDKQIGQNLFVGENEYPCIANPYKITTSNKLVEQTMKTKISILNANILLNYGTITDNIIYVCLLENVVKALPDQFDDYVVKMYYPSISNLGNLGNLGNNGISDAKRQQLIEPSIAMTTGKSSDVFNSIDMFYDVYQQSVEFPLKYSQRGIKQIKITLRTDFKSALPLEAIFKLLHANKTSPLVKQYFYSKRDNIYRVYTDKTTVDGLQIPYLNISSINNISKTLSKVASVAVYIEYMIARTIHSFICAFEETGDISIYAKFDDSHVVTAEEFDKYVKMHVNPVINMVKNTFSQIGIAINLYEHLFHENVEVVQMTYKCVIHDVVKFDALKNIGCISSAFNIESHKTNPVTMRFKRVSNFNKSTSLEAFMIEQVNQGLGTSEIIEMLMQNFNMTDAEANNTLSAFKSEHQMSVGVKKRSQIKINPGFFTSFEYKNKTIFIEVEGINNAFYLKTIPIYIDSLVRIIQPVISTNYPLQKIRELCSGTSKEGVGDVVRKIRDVDVQGLDVGTSLPPSLPPPLELSSDTSFGTSLEPSLEDLLPIEEEAQDKEAQDKEAQNKEDQDKYKSVEIPAINKSKPVFGLADDSEEDESEGEGEEGDDEQQKLDLAEPIEESIEEKVFEKGSDGDGEMEKDRKDEAEDVEEMTVMPELKEIEVPKQAPAKKLFGMDSDSGNEESDEEEVVGGAKKKVAEQPVDASALDTSSIKLKNDNPFPQDRIKARDPVLFESMENSMNSKFKFSKTQNNFTSYSTMCASNIKRQPVILTKEELIELKRNPGALTGKWTGDKYVGDDVLEYGADPKNKNYYMCPRYWCLTTDKMMTHEQVLRGECGGIDKIIPKGSSTPGDNTIYQFFDPSEHGPADEKGQPKNYKQHYPSFLSKNKTNDGYCLPCCFKNFNTPSHIAVKSECLKTATGEKEVEGKMEQVAPVVKKVEKGDYIKGPDKFPLEPTRWGYLPIPIRQFFEEANINTDCQVSSTDTSLKKFTPCLLRRGVERSANQSFIACLASASQIFHTKRSKSESEILPVKTIRVFKDAIISTLSLDKFIRYQNGNLVHYFAKNDPKFNVEDPKYDDPTLPLLYLDRANTKLFNKISEAPLRGETPLINRNKFLKKAVQSFLNFKQYINNDEIIIDYTYLWDLVCEKNTDLFPMFPNGMNLVILSIVDNDVTNNVELICPTNQQPNSVFNTHKNTLILITKEGMYEPIYLLEDKERSNFEILTTFTAKNTFLAKPLRTLFDILIKPMFDKCTPLPSITQSKYNVEDISVKRAIPLTTLLSRLKDLKYSVKHQVINYQGKVIGVVAKSLEHPSADYEGYIPCYPSSINDNNYTYKNKRDPQIDYIFMDEHDKIWNTYDNTILFLQRISNTKNVHHRNITKMKIPCAPILRVVDNGVVIGVLTETNQFVQINDPFVRSISQNETYDLKDINENGYLVGEPDVENLAKDREGIDEYSANNNEPDIYRIEYLRRIKLEENFYNVFKNSVRFLLNKSENIDLKEEIMQLIAGQNTMYNVKIDSVIKAIKRLVKNKIQFFDFGENSLKQINDLISAKITKVTKKTNISAFNYETDDVFEQEIRKIGECIIAKNNDKCGSDFPKFCKKRQSKTGQNLGCTLILPTSNLITGEPSQYFEKIADELVRYTRMRSIFLSPTSHFGINTTGYNLNADEIMLLESSLKDYFKELSHGKVARNDNVSVSVYDDVNPQRSDFLHLNEDKTEDELTRELSGQLCEPLVVDKLSAEVWHACFRNDKGDKFGELIFNETVFCTFKLVSYILNRREIQDKTFKKTYKDPNSIKTLLLREYNKYFTEYVVETRPEPHGYKDAQASARARDKFILKFVMVLILQGKKTRGDQVRSGDTSFASFIEYPDYYLTIMDLWILFQYFKIPVIFLSKSCLFETNAKELVGFSNEEPADMREKFIFIMITSPKNGKIPQYKIITHNDSITISLNDIRDSLQKQSIATAIATKQTIQNFIIHFDASKVIANSCKKK